jgi:RecJ-like exonuclease
MSSLLAKASEDSIETCIQVLEALAGDPEQNAGTNASDGVDFQLSLGLTEDWNMVMSETFDFNAFLT